MSEKTGPPQTPAHIARNTVLVLLLICFLLGCLWRFTSWHQRIGFDRLVLWARIIRGQPWIPLYVIVAFVIAGLLFFVHALLLWVTVFTFDTFHAFVYCELGSLASALVVYGLGRVLRKDVVARIAGSSAGRVSHALAQKGILALFILHVFPICPFSVLNLLAGATHIHFKDYVIGTVLGATPGILVLCLFGHHLFRFFQQPNWLDVLLVTMYLIVGYFVFKKMRKHLLADVLENGEA